MKSLSRWLMVTLLIATLAMVGCEGDDGSDGVSSYQAAVNAGFIDPAEVTEEEYYAALAEVASEPPLAPQEESCNVCHGVDDALSIDEMHPMEDPKSVAMITKYNSVTGTGDTVDFMVYEDDGVTGLPGLADGDFRFYIADIVPVSDGVWSSDYPERWLYEEDDGVQPFGTLTDNGGGSYTYEFAADLEVGDTTAAPEFDVTHVQRLLIRVDTRDMGFYRTIALGDFIIPNDGASTTGLADLDREIVVLSACTACHGDPLQNVSHGPTSGYQNPNACVICHSPIGEFDDDGVLVGPAMESSGFWLASLIHTVHSSGSLPGWPTEGPVDFSEVTYPKEINDCEACHFDDGQVDAADWKSNPTIEACTTCHDVTFGGTPTHSGGSQTNASCTFCHPADGAVTGVIFPVSTVHQPDNTLAYTSTISLSADANTDGVYEVGEEILVTVTTSNVAAGDYAVEGAISRANVYVYGPRALPVPVLTPGSTTDPDFVLDLQVDPLATPDQGRSIVIDDAADDAQILTDADGFKYQLFPITADMAPGTYMVQAYVTTDVADCTEVYRGNTCIDGWDLVTFQVGTSSVEPKAAGECSSCHDEERWGTMYHRSYFGTDGCNACHDQSGNHADPLTNRVHAVHAATVNGDLLGNDWSEVTFPQRIAVGETSTPRCDACHNNSNTTYRMEPNGSFAYACIGCHGDTTGAREHMEQNGAPFPTDH